MIRIEGRLTRISQPTRTSGEIPISRGIPTRRNQATWADSKSAYPDNNGSLRFLRRGAHLESQTSAAGSAAANYSKYVERCLWPLRPRV